MTALTARDRATAVQALEFAEGITLARLNNPAVTVERSVCDRGAVDAVLYVESADESLHSRAAAEDLTDDVRRRLSAEDDQGARLVVLESEAIHTFDVDGRSVRVLIRITTTAPYVPEVGAR